MTDAAPPAPPPADQGPTGDRPSLYIVDAMNFLFRAFHALPPLTTTKGIQTGAVYGLCQMLLRIEREQRPTHLCVVFDAPGENFRHRIFNEYKSHRPPMPADLTVQLDLVHSVIDAFGIQTLVVPGFEADDVIATVARQAVAATMDVVICSSDKDLLQLCGGRIWILDTMRNKRLGVAEVHEKFGVGPDRVGDVLALMGDSIDNVPGVDGIGPKTAAELINRFGSLDELLARSGEVKGKRGEALVAARESVRISRELVRLREDVPLPKSLDDLHRVEIDRARLGVLFRELEFTRLSDQLAKEDAAAAARDAGAGGAADSAGNPAEMTARGEGRAAGSAAAPGDLGSVARATEPPPARIVPGDPDALRALAGQLTTAGAVGIALLWDGTSPVKADLVGVAFAFPDGERVYLPLAHRYLGAPAAPARADVVAHLGPPLADPGLAKHVHDLKVTGTVLARAGLRLEGVVSDAMLAAYVLDPTRSRYDLAEIAGGQGITDVALRTAWQGSGKSARPGSDVDVAEAGRRVAAEAAAAHALGAIHPPLLAARGLSDLLTTLELPLARVLERIELRGVQLDSDYLRRLGQEIGVSLVALEKEIHELAGQPFNINSNKQLGEVLFGKLRLPIIRKTKTGPSTDAETLEELAALHPVPAKIVEYRALTKLKGTYIEALPALVNSDTGRLHTSFNQAVAATGRLSSSDPNLQNIPIRTELGARIRRAFVARPGFRLLSADYSQIELRILAHFSEDPAFLDAFHSGEDIHSRTAAEVFGLPREAVTAEHRRIAKAINFGLVFGQGEFGLAQVLRIPRAQARAYIDSYFRQYSGVRAYMDRAISEARRTGEVTTLLGRRRPLPEIHSSRVQDRNYAERIARNSPIQGSAADLLKIAMIRIDAAIERGEGPAAGAELLLTVHDELVFELPEDRVSTFTPWVKAQMETVFTLKVPLVVEVGAGATWADAHG
ncbi:MAG TPA: DNA polymerase I [Polyangia bacterium]